MVTFFFGEINKDLGWQPCHSDSDPEPLIGKSSNGSDLEFLIAKSP